MKRIYIHEINCVLNLRKKLLKLTVDFLLYQEILKKKKKNIIINSILFIHVTTLIYYIYSKTKAELEH